MEENNFILSIVNLRRYEKYVRVGMILFRGAGQWFILQYGKRHQLAMLCKSVIIDRYVQK